MIFLQHTFLDIPVKGQYGFQDAATAVMHGIINLHHHIFFFLVLVCIFVFFIFLRTYKFSVIKETVSESQLLMHLNVFAGTFNLNKYLTSAFLWNNYNTFLHLKKINKWYKYDVSHATVLEIIWTIIPSLILLCIVGPSFALLYAMDAPINPEITIKIVGHQWYWSYEYTDSYDAFDFYGVNNKVSFNIAKDSYMLATTNLTFGELRLLEVDNPLYIPIFTKIRFDITADDVIHSFAVPSLGIKVDAVPGRINVAYLKVLRSGIFFGQCSELCGVNHGFMPIKVIALDIANFFACTIYAKK